MVLSTTTKEYETKNNLTNEPRPSYSVLSKDKIKKHYPDIKHWIIDLTEEIRFLGLNGFGENKQ